MRHDHRQSAWVIGGGRLLWCYQCGSWRQNLPGCRWQKPSGIGGPNPATREPIKGVAPMAPTQRRIMCLLERAHPMTARQIAAGLGITTGAAKWHLARMRERGEAGSTSNGGGRNAAWTTPQEAAKLRAALAAAQDRLREAAEARARRRAGVSESQISDPFSVVVPRQVWVPQEQWAQRGNHGE